MSITVGVLALQGDVREHLLALRTLGVRAIAVRRVSELEDVDGLIIPGGESTTMDKLLEIFDLARPIRSRIASGLPVFGSCAGMILLADRLVGGGPGQRTIGGLDITVRRNAFGRQVNSFEQDLWVSELSDGDVRPVRAAYIRAPWVEQAGADVEILARTSNPTTGGVRPIVAVRQKNLMATAFHPEMGEDLRFHEFFVDIVRSAVR